MQGKSVGGPNGGIGCLRADKRRLEIAREFATAGDFQSRNPNGEQLERAFETGRPRDKPPRLGSLYLFESLDDAKWHWAKMKGGILYECLIDSQSIQHRGDMRLVDLAGKQLAAGEDTSEVVAQYWAGAATDRPLWELLAPSALASKLISDDQAERKRHLLGSPLLSDFASEAMARFRRGISE